MATVLTPNSAWAQPGPDDRIERTASALEAYGIGSGVNKVVIVNREFIPDRITVILVKQELGF